MGEVWGGLDLRLGRAVAVKVLQDTDPGEEDVRRFVREATVAAGLQHPGITVVFDADAHDGQLFIVTELLTGQDLGKVLAAHPGGLPLDQLLDLGIQFADALAAAHGRGIIHRDLKPANLFIQADERLPGGRLKVCDFGLARDLASSSKVTRLGDVFGTPAYMAPEQWHAAATGPGADLYAVGCILFEMLTGQVPFTGPSMPALMAAHLTQQPVPPRDLKPGVPATLNDLVLSLLAKEPAGRPASAAEVLTGLTRLRDMPRRVQEPSRLPLPPVPRDAPLSVPEPANAPRIGLPSRLICTLTGHTRAVYAVAFSPDGELLATASDETARLWDTTTGQTIRTLTSRNGFVRAVAFSPHGKLLATASDETARLWDATTGLNIRTLISRNGFVRAVAFSPDGKLLATASDDGVARLWDIATGQTIRTLTSRSGSLRAVAFSPNGKLLATASDDIRARLWDPATGQLVRTFAGGVNGVAFSPDGKVLATASVDETVRLWDIATGQTIRTLTSRSGFVRAVAFSPDGKLLATACHDKTAQLWDTATGKAIHTLTGHANTVNGVAFSPDGKLLATASHDKTARLWASG